MQLPSTNILRCVFHSEPLSNSDFFLLALLIGAPGFLAGEDFAKISVILPVSKILGYWQGLWEIITQFQVCLASVPGCSSPCNPNKLYIGMNLGFLLHLLANLCLHMCDYMVLNSFGAFFSDVWVISPWYHSIVISLVEFNNWFLWLSNPSPTSLYYNMLANSNILGFHSRRIKISARLYCEIVILKKKDLAKTLTAYQSHWTPHWLDRVHSIRYCWSTLSNRLI